MDKNCSDNYITKIEDTIKKIEILQKDEIKKESNTFQTINNNENIPNKIRNFQKSTIKK